MQLPHRRPFAPSLAAVLTIAVAMAPAAPSQEAPDQEVPAPARRVAPLGADLQGTVLFDQPNAAAAKKTLWVAYPDDRDAWLDHVQYLADLQLRHREHGVSIGVLLPQEAAARVAAGKPGFVVAGCDGEVAIDGMANGLAVIGCHGVDQVQWVTDSLDGATDLLEMLDGSADRFANNNGVLSYLLGSVADGTGDFGDTAAACVKLWPHSGRAHACAALFHWWCKGDVNAAAKTIEQSLKELADDPVAMTTFVDLVQRGDRFDPQVAKQLAMAMAPAAATAPKGNFTQLVYLRALLRAGQDRLAGRLAATLPKQLAEQPKHLLVLAETLTDLSAGAMFAEVAERVVQRAEALGAESLGADAVWVTAARHKCLVRAGRLVEANKLMQTFRGTDANVSSLNNDCWYMMVRADTMGRFDTYALAQAEEMWRQEGEAMTPGNKDTVALAYFLNGQFERAIELQSTAAQANGNSAEYVGRLTRYQNTLAAQKDRAAPGK